MELYGYEGFLARNEFMTMHNSDETVLLAEGDTFTVRRKEKTCRKYDVVFFRRTDGKYELRQVKQVRPDGYVTLFDNGTGSMEVREEAILGVLTSFCRNGREYSTKHLRYRLYSRMRVLTASLRRRMRHE